MITRIITNNPKFNKHNHSFHPYILTLGSSLISQPHRPYIFGDVLELRGTFLFRLDKLTKVAPVLTFKRPNLPPTAPPTYS